jgi:hypothetical protein
MRSFAGTHRHGEDHPLLLSITFDLAEIADELGNRHEARKHYNRVARFGPAAPGFDQQQVQGARAWLGPSAPPMANVHGQPITLAAPEPIAPPAPTFGGFRCLATAGARRSASAPSAVRTVRARSRGSVGAGRRQWTGH